MSVRVWPQRLVRNASLESDSSSIPHACVMDWKPYMAQCCLTPLLQCLHQAIGPLLKQRTRCRKTCMLLHVVSKKCWRHTHLQQLPSKEQMVL